MERLTLKELGKTPENFAGKEVTVAGWARTIRDSKAFGFIELNDGSCFKCTQIVFERANLENYDEIARSNVGGKNRCRRGIDARLSLAKETPLYRVLTRNRVSSSENEFVRRDVPYP